MSTYTEKNGRSSNFRHKYPGTRQNRGIPKSRKSIKYLQVPRPYLQVPTGTQYRIPTGQIHKPCNRGSTKRRGPAAHGAFAQRVNGASEPCQTHKLEPWHPPLKESVPSYTELPTKAYLTLEVYRNLTDAKPRLLRSVEPRHLQLAEEHTDINRGASEGIPRGVISYFAQGVVIPHAIGNLARFIPEPQPRSAEPQLIKPAKFNTRSTMAP